MSRSAEPSSQPPALIEATGHTQPPILDYAGPSSRGKIRLPAQSAMRIETAPDRLTVTQTLSGKAGAVLALAFAALTLYALGSQGIAPFMRRNWTRYLFDIFLCGAFAAVEIGVMLAVIQNTWRKTVFIVTPAQIILRFWSPLRGTSQHLWPAEKLHDAHIRGVRMPDRRAEFPELELDLWGEPQVRLFLGQPYVRLQTILDEIHRLQPPTLASET